MVPVGSVVVPGGRACKRHCDLGPIRQRMIAEDGYSSADGAWSLCRSPPASCGHRDLAYRHSPGGGRRMGKKLICRVLILAEETDERSAPRWTCYSRAMSSEMTAALGELP